MRTCVQVVVLWAVAVACGIWGLQVCADTAGPAPAVGVEPSQIRVVDVAPREFAYGRNVVPSRDASRIAWSSNRGDSLYVAKSNRTEVQGYPVEGKIRGFITWSPNGSQVFCQYRYDSVEVALLVVDLVRGRTTPIVCPGHGIMVAEWSPDGQKILFNASDGKGSVWTARADGTDMKMLAAPPTGPAKWSPRGDLIAYMSIQPPPGYMARLIVMAPDGSEKRDIYANKGGIVDYRWSPTGRKIGLGSVGDLGVVETATGVVTWLEQRDVLTSYAWLDWAPEGELLVYYVQDLVPGEPEPQVAATHLYVCGWDGSGKRHLCDLPQIQMPEPHITWAEWDKVHIGTVTVRLEVPLGEAQKPEEGGSGYDGR